MRARSQSVFYTYKVILLDVDPWEQHRCTETYFQPELTINSVSCEQYCNICIDDLGKIKKATTNHFSPEKAGERTSSEDCMVYSPTGVFRGAGAGASAPPFEVLNMQFIQMVILKIK